MLKDAGGDIEKRYYEKDQIVGQVFRLANAVAASVALPECLTAAPYVARRRASLLLARSWESVADVLRLATALVSAKGRRGPDTRRSAVGCYNQDEEGS